MNVLLFATVVGVLLATGTYMILRRKPINLLLGLGLLSYGINLLLFSSSKLKQGAPPILDKATFTGQLNDLSNMVDPLPQALILTAIVISFGITAFAVVLVNRRNTLMESATASPGNYDPFGPREYNIDNDDPEAAPDDYKWLEYGLVDEYLHNLERRKLAKPEKKLEKKLEKEPEKSQKNVSKNAKRKRSKRRKVK